MPKSLDWSKLPDSLRYLAGPAETYGKLQFDDPIYDFLQNPQERDRHDDDGGGQFADTRLPAELCGERLDYLSGGSRRI